MRISNKKQFIIATVFLVLLIIAFKHTTDGLSEDRQNQITHARELANTSITSNMSIVEKISVSKLSCDVYYMYGDKDSCYDAVIKEHI